MSEDKIYYGIGKLPKGYRRPTMIEAAYHKQVRYFGRKKIDPVLVNAKITIKDQSKKKELETDLTKIKWEYTKLLKEYKKPNLEQAKKIDIHKKLTELKKRGEDLNDKLKNFKEDNKRRYNIEVMKKEKGKRGRPKKIKPEKKKEEKKPRQYRPKKPKAADVSKKMKLLKK